MRDFSRVMACQSTRAVSTDLLFGASTRRTCFASSPSPNHRIGPWVTLVRIMAGFFCYLPDSKLSSEKLRSRKMSRRISRHLHTELNRPLIGQFSTLNHVRKISRCGPPSQLRSFSSNQRAQHFGSISRWFIVSRYKVVYCISGC